MKKGMDMEKNRMKRWFVTGSMILIILAAVYMLSQSMRGNSEVYQGICWEMLGCELLLLAGGYGLAAAIMGKIKKRRMRRDVLFHVG